MEILIFILLIIGLLILIIGGGYVAWDNMKDFIKKT